MALSASATPRLRRSPMRPRLPPPRTKAVGVQRGEIWRYRPKGPRGERLVLIVSGAGINADDRRAWLIGLDVLSHDPHDLLAVPVPGHGWADASTVVRVYRRWLAEGDRIDVVTPEALEAVDVALRAALDL